MSTNRLTASQSFDWHGAQRMCARLVVELPRNLRNTWVFPKIGLFLETPKWRWGDQKYLANQLGRIVDPIGL